MSEQKMPSKELIQKAQACETPEQLIELAKTEDIELTKEEAEAYLAQMQDVELDTENLQKVAGGGACPANACWQVTGDCPANKCFQVTGACPANECWQVS